MNRTTITIIGTAIGTLALVVAAAVWFSDNDASSQQAPSVELTPDPNIAEAEVIVDGKPISGELIQLMETNGMTHELAVAAAVDQELRYQAAERLDLLPSDEEVAEYIEAYEANLASADEEARLEIEAVLIAQGLPTENLSSDPLAFELFRHARAHADLRTFLHERLAVAELAGVPSDSIQSQDEVDALRVDYTDTEFRNALTAVHEKLSPEVERFTDIERAGAEIQVR